MKRWVLIGGKIHEVDPKEEKVKFIDLGNGVVLAFLEDKPVIFRVKNSIIETPLVYAEFSVLKSLPKDLSSSISSNVQYIKSPMPSLVVEVNKKAGERVKKGETVITIEAMKMRTQLKSRIDGVVKSVYVSPGVSVNKGQILAVIEGTNI
jgi:biotin carboxyl carrier protein